MKEAYLAEKTIIKSAFDPVDLNTAAVTGARIKMDKGDRLAIVVNMGDSTSATDVSFFLKQHNAASSGTTKALSVDNPYFTKVAAATSFTKTVPAVPQVDGDYDLTSLFANDQGMVIFEVLAEDLDVNNGFAWVSIDTADAGAGKIGSAVYIMHNLYSLPGYNQAV